MCVRSASVVFKCSLGIFFCCGPCYEECQAFECVAADLRTGCSMSDASGVEQDPIRPAAASGEVALSETELDPTELDSILSDVTTAASFDRHVYEPEERIASRLSELSVSGLSASEFEIDNHLVTRAGARGENGFFVDLANLDGTIPLHSSNHQGPEWHDLPDDTLDALAPSTLQELGTAFMPLPEYPTTRMPQPDNSNPTTGSQRTRLTRESFCCGTNDEPPECTPAKLLSDEILLEVANIIIRNYNPITPKHVMCVLCSEFGVHTQYKVCENSLVNRTRSTVPWYRDPRRGSD